MRPGGILTSSPKTPKLRLMTMLQQNTSSNKFSDYIQTSPKTANLNPSLTGWANSSNDSEVNSQRNNNISFRIETSQVQATIPLEKIQNQEPPNIQTPTTMEKSSPPLEDLLTSNENSPTMIKEKKRVMLTKVAEESLFKRLSTPKKAATRVKRESIKLQAHSVLESKRAVSAIKSMKKIMKLPDTCRNFAPVAKNIVGLSETPLSELHSHLKPKPVETLGIVYMNKEYKPIHTLRVTKVKSIHASTSVDENREKKRRVPANFRFNEPTEILAASSSESPKNAQRNTNSRSGKRITLYKDIFWSKTALKTHNLEMSTSDDFTDKILDFIEAHPQESKLFLQSPGSLVEAQTFDFTSAAQKKPDSQAVKMLPMPRFKSIAKVRKTSTEKKELSSSYLPSKCGYSPLRLTTTGDSVNYLGREGDVLKSSLPKTTPATGKSGIVKTPLWDNESIKDYDFERGNWISNSKVKKIRHLEANQSLYKKMWNKITEVIADKQLEEEKKLKAWRQKLPRDENLRDLLNSNAINDYINEDDIEPDQPLIMQQRTTTTPNKDFFSSSEEKNDKKFLIISTPNTPIHRQRNPIKVSSLLKGH